MVTSAALETGAEQAQPVPAAGAPPASSEPAALVLRFLTKLGRALHKRRVYPAGHPMRQTAEQTAARVLGDLWALMPALHIGVTKTQLLFAETATDPAHFVLRDLAGRLHRRQVGTIRFRAGTSEAEFAEVLDLLAEEEPGPIPAGRWPNVDVAPLALDTLVLDEHGHADREVDDLWRDLVTVVSGAGATQLLGTILVRRLDVPEVLATVRSALERLGRLASDPAQPGSAVADVQLATLLAAIPPGNLAQVLGVDLRGPSGLAALAPVVDWLPAIALVELIEQAAHAQQHEISTFLVRLLRKMARRPPASPARRPAGEQDVRQIVKGLLEDWTLTDPNTAAHGRILEALSRYDLAAGDETPSSDDALRIVQMAVETETFGDHVADAVERAVVSGGVDGLVALLASAGSDPVASDVWRVLTAPAQLGHLVVDPWVRHDTLHAVLDHADIASIAGIVDRLPAVTPAVRELLGEQLAALGPAMGGALSRRLDAMGAAERRTALAALATLPEVPLGLAVLPYAETDDPLLRLDAYRLAFRLPAERDEAIHAALADPDERIVAAAVTEGRRGFPRASLTRLFMLLNNPARSDALRADGVAILEQFGSPTIREWLLGNLTVRRGWFRLLRLAPKSAVVLAKLRVLVRTAAADPQAERVLRLARRSGDPELAAAAGTEAGR